MIYLKDFSNIHKYPSPNANIPFEVVSRYLSVIIKPFLLTFTSVFLNQEYLNLELFLLQSKVGLTTVLLCFDIRRTFK